MYLCCCLGSMDWDRTDPKNTPSLQDALADITAGIPVVKETKARDLSGFNGVPEPAEHPVYSSVDDDSETQSEGQTTPAEEQSDSGATTRGEESVVVREESRRVVRKKRKKNVRFTARNRPRIDKYRPTSRRVPPARAVCHNWNNRTGCARGWKCKFAHCYVPKHYHPLEVGDWDYRNGEVPLRHTCRLYDPWGRTTPATLDALGYDPTEDLRALSDRITGAQRLDVASHLRQLSDEATDRLRQQVREDHVLMAEVPVLGEYFGGDMGASAELLDGQTSVESIAPATRDDMDIATAEPDATTTTVESDIPADSPADEGGHTGDNIGGEPEAKREWGAHFMEVSHLRGGARRRASRGRPPLQAHKRAHGRGKNRSPDRQGSRGGARRHARGRERSRSRERERRHDWNERNHGRGQSWRGQGRWQGHRRSGEPSSGERRRRSRSRERGQGRHEQSQSRGRERRGWRSRSRERDQEGRGRNRTRSRERDRGWREQGRIEERSWHERGRSRERDDYTEERRRRDDAVTMRALEVIDRALQDRRRGHSRR